MGNESEKRTWAAPKLEQLAIAETATKSTGANESICAAEDNSPTGQCS